MATSKRTTSKSSNKAASTGRTASMKAGGKGKPAAASKPARRGS